WIRSAKSASKKSGIRSGPRRLRIVKRTGRRDRYTNFPKIFVARVFDLTRRCDENNAFIYRRPSKWPIATALAAAVLIHLSAVAIAFHQESPAILPAATDPTIVGVYFADAPPTPPDPDISVPPPGPVPAADFIEPEETRGV